MATISVPAPIGGWNARDPLSAMEPQDAIELINWFPLPGSVNGRGGSITKVTIGTSPIDTLAHFTSSSAEQLLAATNGNIYTVNPTAGTSTSVGSGFSVNNWQTGMFNNKLVFVNGTDLPQVWDGTTLTGIVATLVPMTATAVISSGGTLTVGVKAYRVSALVSGIEGTPSPEATTTTTSGSKTVTVSWQIPSVPNLTGFNVYGNTAGGELLMTPTPLAATITSFVDNGSVAPSGALPTVDNTPKILLGNVNFKGRAFYWAKNVCGFWYALAGAFQGSLTYFPLDLVFHKGGNVVQVLTWSRDSGDGVDDICAIISSNGEALVYQGLGPDILTQWSLIGRFSVGIPMSVRAHAKIQSAEVIASSDGFMSMDEAIVNQQSQETSVFGGKIIRAANFASQNYAGLFGWECFYYPRGSWFIINVPINTTGTQFEQYVRNADTGAWCRFTGMNARTWNILANRLYFGDANGNIVLADASSADTNYGYGDNGLPVLRSATTAYLQLTQPGMKSQITGVELVTNMFYPSKASINILADYGARNLPAVIPADVFGTIYWDTSHWDTFYWGDPDTDPTNIAARPVRYSIGNYGFANAISFRYNFKAQQLVWYSTNVLFNQAGV